MVKFSNASEGICQLEHLSASFPGIMNPSHREIIFPVIFISLIVLKSTVFKVTALYSKGEIACYIVTIASVYSCN